MTYHFIQCFLPGMFLMAPFWMALWFKVIAILLILATAFIYHRIKVRRLMDQQLALQSKVVERDELLLYSKENEKKAREEALVATRKKSELLAKLSHEIRTPMNGVIGMASLLRETSLTGEQQQYLKSISNCSEDLIVSLNEILSTDNIAGKSPLQQSQHELRNKQANKLKLKERAGDTKHGAQKLSDNFSQESPMRILVAEDDMMNQQLALMILKRLGYEADILSNGKEVLEAVSEKNYDLILMDVQMPEMDGLEATRMIRLCLNTQPVIIAMTANAMVGDREECLRAGMDDYISKPINLEELMDILQKWALHVKDRA